MKDFAISDDPRVQAQLDRLGALSLPQGRIGLGAVRELCARLGDPQDRMPPVFHVAGTNGKGSTCAYLRAILEAQGLRVHAATKPHLVRYNERIRIAGKLIGDAMLAELLEEVLDAAEGLGAGLAPSFFEVTAVATFLAFHREPADACVIETGLGGRLDATNVMRAPAVCGIASLGIDHEAFLLSPEAGVPDDPLTRIAFEKAGIAKHGVPLVTQAYPARVHEQLRQSAAAAGAPLVARGEAWHAVIGDAIRYSDAAGPLDLPLPALAGEHQADNAALAVAMLRHQTAVPVGPGALAQGIVRARWPARLQELADGPLRRKAGDRAMWLDGGHNLDAGVALARFFAGRAPVHLVLGMLASKDPAAMVGPLTGLVRSIAVVPTPGHDGHGADAFAAFTDLPVRQYAGVAEALAALPPGGDVLIAGSLYLAGEVLRLNGEIPD